MNGLPYYKAYPRDFIEGTIGMSFEMKGAYRLVLDLIYMQNGHLVDDARYISGLLGCTIKKWNSLRNALIVSGKIYVSGDFLKNYRADNELETTAKLQEKNRENRAGSFKNNDLQKRPLKHTDTDTDTDKATLSSVADAPPRDDLDILQSKLLEAAGDGKIQGHGALVVGPIAELVAQGVSLDLDILPTIRAICSRRDRPVASWSYFVGAIREAFERRVSSGKGLHVPAPVQETEDLWQRRLRWARANRKWETSAAGPMPGRPGCRVPQHLLQDSDGDGWHDMDDDRRPSLTLVHNNRQARHA